MSPHLVGRLKEAYMNAIDLSHRARTSVAIHVSPEVWVEIRLQATDYETYPWFDVMTYDEKRLSKLWGIPLLQERDWKAERIEVRGTVIV